MKTILKILVAISLFAAFAHCSKHSTGNGDNKEAATIKKDTPLIKLGAYYFGGWYEGSAHITDALVNNFPERKPIWGWVTSTPAIVKAEIDSAANAGLYFFSYCWYFNPQDLSDNKGANTALKLYLNAPNKNRLKFCLLIANHSGYYLTPQNWPVLKEHWKKLFKEPTYLTVDGKPLIIFFEYASLITNFGSADAVKKLLSDFREEVKAMGLNGIVIAGCAYPGTTSINAAISCGFDVLTGYNHASSGLSANITTPIENMYNAEYITIYNKFKEATIPYIPVGTLNWDKRPWSTTPEQEKRFTGFSGTSAYNTVNNMKKWILANSANTTKEKLGILYAWNEYGEGGWLSPSAVLKDSLLQGVAKALK